MDLALLVMPKLVPLLLKVFLDLWKEYSTSVFGVVTLSRDNRYLKVLCNILVSSSNRLEYHLKQPYRLFKSQEV